MKVFLVLVFTALTMLSTQTTNADTPPRYLLTVLPLTFYSLSKHGSGLNNKGQIVGDSTADRIEQGKFLPLLLRLALWGKSKTRLLISAQTQKWMSMSSTAAGINERGQVIGNFQVISSGGWTYYSSHAFFWSKGHLVNIPSLPGDDYCAVLGINNHGDAVGTSNQNIPGQLAVNAPPGTDIDTPHAFVYRRSKTISLGVGSANSINDRGQIAGDSGGKAVVWQNGGRKTLGEGEAAAINNQGLVVGTCGFTARQPGKTRACLWQNGRQVTLSSLPSYAYSINTHGQIVGDVVGTGAILWQRGEPYDLNRCVRLPKGWVLDKAVGINDRGWIIGEGHVDSGPSPQRAFTFLLTQEGK